MTCDEYRAALAEAEKALHSLTLGGLAVRVRDGPSEVEFAKADIPRLERLIALYESKIAACDGTPCVGRRVLRFVPG